VGYKKHPFAHEPWRYLDVLPRESQTAGRNH
jgi:hypothetical protein